MQLGVEQLANFRFHNFESMVLNHGMMQNHAHLHLKISVTPSCASEEMYSMHKGTKSSWFANWMDHIERADLGDKLRTLQVQYIEPCKLCMEKFDGITCSAVCFTNYKVHMAWL